MSLKFAFVCLVLGLWFNVESAGAVEGPLSESEKKASCPAILGGDGKVIRQLRFGRVGDDHILELSSILTELAGAEPMRAPAVMSSEYFSNWVSWVRVQSHTFGVPENPHFDFQAQPVVGLMVRLAIEKGVPVLSRNGGVEIGAWQERFSETALDRKRVRDLEILGLRYNFHTGNSLKSSMLREQGFFQYRDNSGAIFTSMIGFPWAFVLATAIANKSFVRVGPDFFSLAPGLNIFDSTQVQFFPTSGEKVARLEGVKVVGVTHSLTSRPLNQFVLSHNGRTLVVADHSNDSITELLVSAMFSGQTVALLVEGESQYQRVRGLEMGEISEGYRNQARRRGRDILNLPWSKSMIDGVESVGLDQVVFEDVRVIGLEVGDSGDKAGVFVEDSGGVVYRVPVLSRWLLDFSALL